MNVELQERNTNEAGGSVWISSEVVDRIDNRLERADPGAAFLVYVTLLTIARECGDNPTFAISKAEIIAKAKLPKCAVLNALKDLQRLEILEIEQGGGPGEPDIYSLLVYRPNTYMEPDWATDTHSEGVNAL